MLVERKHVLNWLGSVLVRFDHLRSVPVVHNLPCFWSDLAISGRFWLYIMVWFSIIFCILIFRLIIIRYASYSRFSYFCLGLVVFSHVSLIYVVICSSLVVFDHLRSDLFICSQFWTIYLFVVFTNIERFVYVCYSPELGCVQGWIDQFKPGRRIFSPGLSFAEAN